MILPLPIVYQSIADLPLSFLLHCPYCCYSGIIIIIYCACNYQCFTSHYRSAPQCFSLHNQFTNDYQEIANIYIITNPNHSIGSQPFINHQFTNFVEFANFHVRTRARVCVCACVCVCVHVCLCERESLWKVLPSWKPFVNTPS